MRGIAAPPGDDAAARTTPGMGGAARERIAAAWTGAASRLTASPLAILATLAIVSLAQAPLLVYGDLNLQYPFMFPDSYDWIANGLYYAGHPVNYSVRPPGLPIIIAALARVGALRLLPLLNLAVALGIIAVCHRLVRRGVSRQAAAFAVTLLFANYFFHTLAYYVLADLYCLLFMALSLHEFLAARREGAGALAPRRYLSSAFFLGISVAFQYAGVTLLPAYALVWLCYRRHRPAWGHLVGAAAIVAAALAPWMLYRWLAFGDPLYSRVLHEELVRWHIDGVPFYLYNAVGAAGIAACALALVGLVVALRRGLGEEAAAMLLFLAGNVVFWVFLYDWNDRRFVLYWLIPIYYLVARGADAVARALPMVRGRGLALASAAMLFFLHANLDSGSPLSIDRIALSPWHTVVARLVAAERGGLDIDLGALRVERVERPVWTAFAATKPLQARLSPPAGPGASELAQARTRLAARFPDGYAPLYMHFGAGPMGSWYLLRNRYGNMFLTVMEPVASLDDVPDGRPVLMLKPYDAEAIAACELLWDGPDAILLVTGEGCAHGQAS